MIDKVRPKVAQLLDSDRSGHGMDHVERVCSLAMKFARKEGADPTVTRLIALLHDADDYKLFGMENARDLSNSRRILEECGIPDPIQKQVLSALADIGYSKRLMGHVPSSIEGMVVSDSDMCDAIGANGILRVYAYSMKEGRPFFDRGAFPVEDVSAESYTGRTADSSVDHMFEKLLRLKGLMLTGSGREEAARRDRVVVDFLYSLFEEEDAAEWKAYLDDYLLKR